MEISIELWSRVILTALLLIIFLSFIIQKIFYVIQRKKTSSSKKPLSNYETEIQIDNIQDNSGAGEETKVEAKTEIKKIYDKTPISQSLEKTKDIKKPPKKMTEAKKHNYDKQIENIKVQAKRLYSRDPDAYEKKLIEGLALSSKDVELLEMLTDHYFSLGEYKKSLSLLKRILNHDKTHHKAMRQIGEIYLQQGDPQTAEIMIEKAVKENRDNPKYLYSLVDIKYNSGNIEDAIYLIEKILQLRPTNVEYLTAAAMLYEKKGDIKQAKKYYFEILQQEPDNRTAKTKIKEL